MDEELANELKIAEKKYSEGEFVEAGAAYENAANMTKEIALKRELIKKSEEAYLKADDFNSAAVLYSDAAEASRNKQDKIDWYSKAVEYFSKSGDQYLAGVDAERLARLSPENERKERYVNAFRLYSEGTSFSGAIKMLKKASETANENERERYAAMLEEYVSRLKKKYAEKNDYSKISSILDEAIKAARKDEKRRQKYIESEIANQLAWAKELMDKGKGKYVFYRYMALSRLYKGKRRVEYAKMAAELKEKAPGSPQK
ncbi:MAG: hypothetical protein NT051_00990 [Candidatus Micrarchaeota archaeon]|nr:hypothetical protein [Candidatus Micrarchaeota archaeon]